MSRSSDFRRINRAASAKQAAGPVFEGLEERVLLSANTNILVVYNAGFTGDLDGNGVQDSLQVANYYALKRGVPAANLLGVNPSSEQTLTYDEYKTQVAQPVQDKLVALGTSNINYILLIYGMPWRVGDNYSLDNALASPTYSLSHTDTFSVANPYLERNPLYTSSGTYDAGASDKGHFSHSYTVTGGYAMYLVSRLDGPVDSALGIFRITNLVDQAIYAEKYISTGAGYLNGTMYVSSPYPPDTFTVPATDSDIKTGSYSSVAGAQKNIGYAGQYAEIYGVPWANVGSQNDNAFMYSGWLNYGYQNTFEWLPGGTGVDLNSNSLGWSIRAGAGSFAWGTNALADGITGVIGVTNEPFLSGHSRPNIFNYYLLKGYTFGEAAALSAPNIGWMELNIGDPLYAPFAPKTNVVDSSAPAFVSGYPNIDWSSNGGYVVDILLNDNVVPEAAAVKVDFGLTTAYGQSGELTQFYLHHRVPLGELLAGRTYHYRVTATDAAGNVTVSSDATFQTVAQTPYGGTAWPIAGTVQFENYDVGGEGIAYHDTEPLDTYNYNNPRPNEGVEMSYFDPISVWMTRAGEWLEYTVNVTQTGSYNLEVNSQSGGGNQFHFEVDGVDVTGPLTTPGTGGYAIATKTGMVLSSGIHVVRVKFDFGPGDGWVGEFDWFKFTFVDSVPQVVSAAVNGGAAQRSQIDTLSFTFNKAVTVSIGSLTLHNDTTGTDVSLASASFFYNSSSRVATWTVTALALPDGRYTATLIASSVTDANSVPLYGGNYSLPFFRVLSDANGDAKVDGGDLAIWQQNYDPLGIHQNGPGNGDWNGDGKIDGGDLALWQQHYNPLGLSSVVAPEPLTVEAGGTVDVVEDPAGSTELVTGFVIGDPAGAVELRLDTMIAGPQGAMELTQDLAPEPEIAVTLESMTLGGNVVDAHEQAGAPDLSGIAGPVVPGGEERASKDRPAMSFLAEGHVKQSGSALVLNVTPAPVASDVLSLPATAFVPLSSNRMKVYRPAIPPLPSGRSSDDILSLAVLNQSL